MLDLPQSSFLAMLVLAIGLTVAHAVVKDILFFFGFARLPSPFIGFLIQLYKIRKGWPYMVRGPQLINEGYRNGNGQPFVIETPSAKHHILSSTVHIRELDMLSSKNLSLHAAAKDILQPRYTYAPHQWEWPDLRGAESVGFNRAVRSLLTNNLVKVAPSLNETLVKEFEARVASCKIEDGWIEFSIMPNVSWTFMIVNSLLFFGGDFANSEEMRIAMSNYQEVVPFCAELVKFTPSFTAPLLCRILTTNYRAYRSMHKFLVSDVEKRIQLRNAGKPPDEKPLDGIQWMLDTSPKPNHKKAWNATRAIDETISSWYTSVPQLSAITTFAVHDLALYPEWQEKLVDELRGGGYETLLATGQGLPLMESFIKESTRLSPIDGVVCRRKVISGPVEFSNGVTVEEGDWVTVPQQAMWRDERLFPDPDTFNPMRFSSRLNEPGLVASESRQGGSEPELTEVSPTWVLWGFGRTACPGRFYATFAIKLLLSHVLLNYQIKARETKKRYFSWTSAIVPSNDMEILMKRL